MALDFDGANDLINPQGMDFMALGNMFQQNPEALIPFLTAQGIKPPTDGGNLMASADNSALPSNMMNSLPPNMQQDPYSKGPGQQPEVLPPLPTGFQPPPMSVTQTPPQAPGMGALPPQPTSSGAEPSGVWGPSGSDEEPSSVWGGSTNALTPSNTPPASLASLFSPLSSLPQVGTGGLSPSALGGAPPQGGAPAAAPAAPVDPRTVSNADAAASTRATEEAQAAAKAAQAKNLAGALSGIKMPARPEIQKITSPHPYTSHPMPQGNPVMTLLQQMLGQSTGAQPLHLNHLVK